MSGEIIALIIPAFIAGILTIFAPCTLPLVPAYLGFISGVSLKHLEGAAQEKIARKKIFTNAILFVVGFTAIFVTFGVFAGLFGQFLNPLRAWLARIGGALITLFGFKMVGIWNSPFPFLDTLFSREWRLHLSVVQPGNPLSSLLLGGAFAFGWTPCIGPILGTILFLVASSATALSGGLLLLIFSMGLAIPFLLVAIGIGSSSRIIQSIAPSLSVGEKISGALLIILGLLLLSGKFGLLVLYSYRFFEFIHYDRLLNYL
jgi:cytochrome c-type biogenesis protein